MTTTMLLESPSEQLAVNPSVNLTTPLNSSNSLDNPFDNEDAARRYDRAIDALPYFKDTIKKLVEYADIQSADKVVDLACGTGYSTRFILEKSPVKVYGVDSARAMLEYAGKKFGGRVKLLHGMAESLDMLIEERVDKVICTFGFSYFVEPEKVITGVYNALAPNGRFVFNVAISSDGRIMAAHKFEKTLYRELSRLLKEKLGVDEVPRAETPDIKERKYTQEEITMLLESAGFIVKEYDEIDCKVTPSQLKESYLAAASGELSQEGEEILEEAIDNALEELSEYSEDGYYNAGRFALIAAVKSSGQVGNEEGEEREDSSECSDECSSESNDHASSESSCNDC